MNQKKQQTFISALLAMVLLGGGAGIFHKANFILESATDVAHGVLAIAIGGLTVLFGCLALLPLAKESHHSSVLGLYEYHFGKTLASGYGWFYTFVATPSIIAVLAWVAGIYTINCFGYHADGLLPIFIGMGYLTFIAVFNLISHKTAQKIQRWTTMMKYLPLLFIGVWGLIFGSDTIVTHPDNFVTTQMNSMGWLCAMSPVAFCFENWFVALSRAKHTHHERKAKLLATSSLIIMALYIVYFLGISAFGHHVVAYHNNHLWEILASVFSSQVFSRLMMLLVLIAILGTLDTLCMSQLNMPDIMSERNYLGKAFSKEVKNVPVNSMLLGYGATMFWLAVHLVFEEVKIFTQNGTPETDVAEISVIATFVLLIPFYVKSIVQFFKGEKKGAFLSLVCPIVATLGTICFVVGGMMSNPIIFEICLCLWILSFLAGAFYYKIKKKHNADEQGHNYDKINKFLD